MLCSWVCEPYYKLDILVCDLLCQYNYQEKPHRNYKWYYLFIIVYYPRPRCLITILTIPARII